jgi:hypothetical protein
MVGGRRPSGRKSAVASVNAAKSNAARTMAMSIASTGGVTEVVRRMLVERSIGGTVTADADLREIGLTSLDMVDLVLSVISRFPKRKSRRQISDRSPRSMLWSAPCEADARPLIGR